MEVSMRALEVSMRALVHGLECVGGLRLARMAPTGVKLRHITRSWSKVMARFVVSRIRCSFGRRPEGHVAPHLALGRLVKNAHHIVVPQGAQGCALRTRWDRRGASWRGCHRRLGTGLSSSRCRWTARRVVA